MKKENVAEVYSCIDEGERSARTLLSIAGKVTDTTPPEILKTAIAMAALSLSIMTAALKKMMQEEVTVEDE